MTELTRSQRLDPKLIREAAAQAVGRLKLLANEQRMLLLSQLTHGEMCVNDLEKRLKIYQPTLSQQLSVLRREGVVKTRHEGKHIFYSIADSSVLKLLACVYRLSCPED
jgi:ArsR family transcriptional regulator